MEVNLSRYEVLDRILQLNEDDLLDLFESHCPQCEGYGHYFDGLTNKAVEYCSVCDSNQDYREPSEFTKVLVKVLRKHGALPT